MELEKDKYYYCEDSAGILIFKFTGKYSQERSNAFDAPKYYYVISNMNKHHERKFYERKDGINTYPFQFKRDGWLSVGRRNVRLANEHEIAWLEKCNELNIMVTNQEMRDIIISHILDRNV